MTIEKLNYGEKLTKRIEELENTLYGIDRFEIIDLPGNIRVGKVLERGTNIEIFKGREVYEMIRTYIAAQLEEARKEFAEL